jgi:hypothetical protein
MLWLKPLLDRRAKQAFRAGFYALTGTDVDSDYLLRCAVFGLFSNATLVGGFVINRELPLRILDAIVGRERPRTPDCVSEVSCYWLAAGQRRLASRLALYAGSVVHAGPGELLGVTTNEKLWRRLFEPMSVRLIYHGPVELSPGSRKQGRIFTVTRHSALRALPRYLLGRSEARIDLEKEELVHEHGSQPSNARGTPG